MCKRQVTVAFQEALEVRRPTEQVLALLREATVSIRLGDPNVRVRTNGSE
jgi:hypothetical protein